MGVGAGISETTTDETGTVWSAQELKVDYEPATETAEEAASVAMTAEEGAAQKIAESTPTRSDERKNEKTAETASEKVKAESKAIGANVFFIVAGLLVCCGLVKFIFDHYIR